MDPYISHNLCPHPIYFLPEIRPPTHFALSQSCCFDFFVVIESNLDSANFAVFTLLLVIFFTHFIYSVDTPAVFLSVISKNMLRQRIQVLLIGDSRMS